jgi:hypothetical protein
MPERTHHGQPADPTMPDPGAIPPSWGWPGPGAGRTTRIATPPRYQGTSVQLCGLYPFTSGSGSPSIGVPIGRHMHWGEVVALDPIEWVRRGLATNPGIFVLGEPGTGKSAIAKRLAAGMVAYGAGAIVVGDLKGEYGPLVRNLSGQVVRVGWGLDRLNPLDAGPLAQALPELEHTDPDRARALQQEIRARRLTLLEGLCLIARGNRGGPITDAEELALGGALDTLAQRDDRQPIIPEVQHAIETGGPEMQRAVLARDTQEYRDLTIGIVRTLARIQKGLLRGLFDGPTTTPIDLGAPAVAIDIHALDDAADDIVAAALLCTWSTAYSSVDAARATGDTRPYITIQDEMWRALRTAPGLVERIDRLTRLNRTRGIGSVNITHSLADPESLPTPEDRAKARGLIERSALTIMSALPDVELGRVHAIRPLTSRERQMVSSWSAPEAWEADIPHPGRGLYLVKNAGRLGIPIEMHLTDRERGLYDTDQAIRAPRATAALSV